MVFKITPFLTHHYNSKCNQSNLFFQKFITHNSPMVEPIITHIQLYNQHYKNHNELSQKIKHILKHNY